MLQKFYRLKKNKNVLTLNNLLLKIDTNKTFKIDSELYNSCFDSVFSKYKSNTSQNKNYEVKNIFYNYMYRWDSLKKWIWSQHINFVKNTHKKGSSLLVKESRCLGGNIQCFCQKMLHSVLTWESKGKECSLPLANKSSALSASDSWSPPPSARPHSPQSPH